MVAVSVGTRASSCSTRSRISEASAVFGPQRRSTSSPSGADERRGVGLDVEAGVLPRDVVGDDQVDLLATQLLRGRARRGSPLSAAKPTSTGAAAPPRARAELGEDVRRAHERQVERAVGLLDLACRARRRSGV